MTQKPAKLLLGGNLFGYSMSKLESHAVLRKALSELGILAFDTAEAYQKGESERIIGDFIQKSKVNEDQVFSVTKLSINDAEHKTFKIESLLTKKMRASLARLGLKTVDVVLLHNPTHSIDALELASGFESLVERGLAKCFGLSNPDDTIWSSIFLSSGASAVQRHLTPLNLDARTTLNDKISIGYGIFARGLLMEAKAEDAKSRVSINPRLRNIYFDSRMVEVRQRLRRIANDMEISVPELLVIGAIPAADYLVLGIREGDTIETFVDATNAGSRLVDSVVQKLAEIDVSELPKEFLGSAFAN